MQLAIDALLPVFLVITVGFGIQRAGLMTEPMWEGLERITYYVLFPILLTETLAGADFAGVPVVEMGVAMLLAVITMTLILLALRPLVMNVWGLGGPTYTSFFQGGVRWHTFVGLAVVGNLFGTQGIALASVAAAAMIPYLNVVAALVLARWASPKRPTAVGLLVGLAKNPFIWSSALGIALNVLSIPIWSPVMTAADLIGRATLGISLLLVGAGLRIPESLSPRREVLLAIALKLGLMPVLMAGWCTVFGVTGVAFKAAVICGGVQTAANSYILARQMGGDAPLMASIITMQTLAAIGTLPIVLWVLG